LAGCSIVALLVGLLNKHSTYAYFLAADRFDYVLWSAFHRSEATLAISTYICISIAAGYALGIVNGWLNLNHPILRLIESSPRVTKHLQRLGIFSLLEERPLSFEMFTGEAVSRRTDLIYFLELQLRDEKGFVTGELVKFAIVKDEEPHRPILLRDAQFKHDRGDDYKPMEGDRILIDLADALLVQVSYRERAQVLMDEQQQSS